MPTGTQEINNASSNNTFVATWRGRVNHYLQSGRHATFRVNPVVLGNESDLTPVELAHKRVLDNRKDIIIATVGGMTCAWGGLVMGTVLKGCSKVLGVAMPILFSTLAVASVYKMSDALKKVPQLVEERKNISKT